MSQPNNVIKLGLPPQISNFTFSYETKQPGPVTITIAVGGEPSKAVADVPVQSTSAGEPVIADPPVFAGEPVIAEPPVRVGNSEPIIAEPPVLVDEPIIAELPVLMDAPVIEDPPVVAESPVKAIMYSPFKRKRSQGVQAFDDSETEPDTEISDSEPETQELSRFVLVIDIDNLYQSLMPEVQLRCYCTTQKCNGKFVSKSLVRAHERTDLRQRTTAAQARFQSPRFIPSAQRDTGPVSRSFPVPLHPPPPPLSPDLEFHDPPRTSDSPVEQEMLDNGFLTGEDLDIMTFGRDLPNLGPNFHSPEALIAAVDHYTAYNAATSAGAHPLTAHQAHHLPITPEERAIQQQLERLADEIQHNQSGDFDDDFQAGLDEDEIDIEAHEDGDVNDLTTTVEGLIEDEDDPDPFMLEENFHSEDRDLSEVPAHNLTIYALVSWLHLQFHLPRVACNAMLAILSCILLALSPTIATPFITLQSSNRVLGVDKPICLLPVCPVCRNVFPPAGSTHTQDTCPTCNIPLFQSDHTKRGNLRAIKTPVVKYPYLPLSTQIRSILKVPGLEAILDQWRAKPRVDGEYTDIFDGSMCRTQLKGPDGELFFSNRPHEKSGPDGELRIGVNLGVDW
ncbi:hypothetical protein PAXINDRAFT_13450 [Paxillus involutus ATCC 200175]|uniref:Uncharacterized protein n=1 Tax=Paxillus involutus ATCC 200175 TaxID=664439 RepID=A0A0C9SW68_PAXIN|nr:hypothetical protein PAXINDRAFT_13450 [Paxillus involutus ATCC 200175]